MRPFRKIRRIDNIIVKNNHLNTLQNKITHLVALKKRILSTLCEPPPCDFTVTEFAQTTLHLSVNQSGFAVRLRFLAPDWVQQLRQADPEFWRYLAQIKVQISPGQTNTAIGQTAIGKSDATGNSSGSHGQQPTKRQFVRIRPQSLIDAKALLTEQNIDAALPLQTSAKSATRATTLPIKAKGHGLRQLVYETGSSVSAPLQRPSDDSSEKEQQLALRPESLQDSGALDEALERLWGHVYNENTPEDCTAEYTFADLEYP